MFTFLNAIAVAKFILAYHQLVNLLIIFQHWKKSYDDIYHSPPRVCVITGNILQQQPPEVFCKKEFLETSQNSQEHTCASVSFSVMAHVFSCEFCEISKNSFFTEHLWWLRLMLITIIRFGRYRILLASNCTFMSDSHYWGTIQIWQNLDEHQYYLTSTKSVICQIDTNCSPFQSLNMLPFHIRLRCLTL